MQYFLLTLTAKSEKNKNSAEVADCSKCKKPPEVICCDICEKFFYEKESTPYQSTQIFEPD